MKTQEVKDKMQNTMLQKYGNKVFCKSEGFRKEKFLKLMDSFKDFVIPLFSFDDFLKFRL